jgi:hypothetical protein
MSQHCLTKTLDRSKNSQRYSIRTAWKMIITKKKKDFLTGLHPEDKDRQRIEKIIRTYSYLSLS